MIEAPRLEAIDLWFGYAPGRPALRGADLVVEPGEFLALVGQNGLGEAHLPRFGAGGRLGKNVNS